MFKSSEKDPEAGLATPGQLLREQRKNNKLSINEVVEQLHLDERLIRAIEADDADQFASTMYVRGYLRSYAKVVGADADKIVELYNSKTPLVEPEILPEVIKSGSQLSSKDKPVKAFTYLLTLALVILLLIWYQSNFVIRVDTSDDDGIEQEKVLMDTETGINGVDVTSDVVTHDDDSWGEVTVAATETTLPVVENDGVPQTIVPEVVNDTVSQPADVAIVETITPAPVVESSPPIVPEVVNDTVSQPADVAIVETITSTPVVESSPPKIVEKTFGSGYDTIVIDLLSESWVDVSEGEGHKVFAGLGKAGERYTLKGSAPFDVLLGFANAVRMTFNGKVVSFKANSSSGTARFSVPD